MPEHRRSERHRLAFKVIFDDGESYNAGEAEDISETGMFLHSSTELPAGSIVRFEPADDEEDALFEAAARVVRCEPLDGRTEASHGLVGIAVEFIAMTPDEKDGVRQMIEALEKKKRTRSESGVHDPFLGMRVDEVEDDGGLDDTIETAIPVPEAPLIEGDEDEDEDEDKDD